MVRQIHTETENPTAQPESVTPPKVETPAAAIPLTQENQDALAGALPNWDLLPATAFVRRKRS